MSNWDFKYLGICEYPVPSPPRSADQEMDCREPAIARVWWEDERVDGMLVCAQHLDLIRNTELSNEIEADAQQPE